MRKSIRHLAKKVCLLGMAAALVLSGCSKEGKVVSEGSADGKNDKETKAMGRYVEADIPLPEGEDMKSIEALKKDKDGNIVLITMDKSQSTILCYLYTLTGEKKWEKEPCKWINDLRLPAKNTSIKVVFGQDGKLYAHYSISEGEETPVPTHVITSADGSKVEEITIPMLTKVDKSGWYSFVEGLEVLANGNLVIGNYGKINIIRRESGKVITEIGTELWKMAVRENTIYHYDTKANCIDFYDGESGEKLKSKPITLKEPYGAKLEVMEDNALVVYSDEGIWRLKDGSDLWEVVVSAETGTISSPRYYGTYCIPGAKDDYYVLFTSTDEQVKLSYYTFDPNMPQKAETSLTVYALKGNPVIKQAASEFQVNHPDISIDVQFAMEEDSAAMEEDYIRTLNTELLAGKGPDVLILDGLPIDSLIEKGVLSDLSSIILPMVSSGEILPNIAEKYTKDGKIYMMPTKIAIPMAFGNSELTKIAGDLEAVASYIEKNPDKNVFGTIDPKEMLSFYLDAYSEDLMQKDQNLNLEQMSSLLKNMKRVADGSTIQNLGKDIRKSSEWDMIREGNLLYTANAGGFYLSQWYFSVISQIDASYASLNQSFVPIGRIGINHAGNNKDIAEEFIKAVLSVESQETDYYTGDGLPVNQKALENYKTIERSSADGYGGSIDGADGKTYEMRSKWPSKEQREGMINICKTVRKEAFFDPKLKEIVLDKTTDYFTGKQTLEQTMEAIAQASKAYLAE